MTGNIPGFVDVVLNFGSTVLTEDNLIGQLKTDKWRMNFFGDDTWIKLFPRHFAKEDGTTSFFVADYTEVSLSKSCHGSTFSWFKLEVSCSSSYNTGYSESCLMLSLVNVISHLMFSHFTRPINQTPLSINSRFMLSFGFLV